MQIGEKIKTLRLKNALTQEELANRCELSKGFISQLERDMTSPSIASLVDLLECLGTDLNEFFSDRVEEKIVFTEQDFFENEDKDHGYLLRWIVPNAQKNMMEPILLEIGPGGSFVDDGPHQGEEFGYVLQGAVTVVVGGKKYKAKKGETFYYKTQLEHTIKNPGKLSAKILMVAAPPNF